MSKVLVMGLGLARLALTDHAMKTMEPWDFCELSGSAGRPKSRNGTGRRTGVAAAKRVARAARNRKARG